MSKYYTPEISEFHVGFECETRCSTEETFKEARCIIMEQHSFSGGSMATLLAWPIGNVGASLCPYTSDLNIAFRVKCLSQEDIEKCGWKSCGADNYEIVNSENENFWLKKYDDGDVIISQGDGFDFVDDECCFNGEIKNISELRFQMKRLAIT